MTQACMIQYIPKSELYAITYKGDVKMTVYSPKYAQIIAVYTQIQEMLWSHIQDLGISTYTYEVRTCQAEHERAGQKIQEYFKKVTEEYNHAQRGIEEARRSYYSVDFAI